MATSLTLDALQDFVFCPMRYWWRQVAHLQEPETLDQAAQIILCEAILEYARIYWMEAKPEPTVVHQAIQDNAKAHHLQVMVATLWGYRFIDWKQAELGRLQRKYGRADAEIVVNSVSGGEEYRRPDGSPYEAPRLTKVYQKLAREAGLLEMNWSRTPLPHRPQPGSNPEPQYGNLLGPVTGSVLPSGKCRTMLVMAVPCFALLVNYSTIVARGLAVFNNYPSSLGQSRTALVCDGAGAVIQCRNMIVCSIGQFIAESTDYLDS